MTGDLPAIDQLLGPMLAKLGVGDLGVFTTLSDRWDELAGPPWAGTSRPQIIRHRELLVEANTTAAVRVLRFAAESLAKRLSDHFGGGVIDTVRVVAPARPPRRSSL